MATKIVYLLIPFMTPFVFFLAAQITYDYGVLGLLGYSTMWTLSFILTFFVENKSGVLLTNSTLKKTVKSIYRMEIIICIFLVIKIIVTEIIPGYLAIINITLLITIPLLIIYLNKMNEKLVSIGTVLLGITLSFLIPTLVYLKVSIPTVYSGLHFLSTDLLKFDRVSTWWLILSIGIVLIAQQYIYRMENTDYKEQYKLGPFIIAGVIAAIVTISFGSISFLGSAQAVIPNLSDRVSIQVIYRFGGQFGQVLFVAILFFISFFILFKMWQSIKIVTVKSIPFSVGKYLFIPLIIVLYFNLTILDVFLLFGLLWGPFAGVIFLPSSLQNKTKLALFLGVAMSFTFAVLINIPAGIIIGAIASIGVTIGVILLELYRNRRILT